MRSPIMLLLFIVIAVIGSIVIYNTVILDLIKKYKAAKERKKRLKFLMKVRKIPKYRIAALLKSGKLVYTKIRFIDVDLYEDSCVLGSSLLLIKNEIEYLRERRRSFLFTQDGYMYNMGEVYLLLPVLASDTKESPIKSIKYITVKKDK